MSHANPPVGHVLGPDEHRDAIHIAIAPVTAGQALKPGAQIVVTDGKAYSASDYAAIGIVDPFLKQGLEPGERFFVFLTPYTVTSLRHHWEHPAFDRERVLTPVDISRKWLEDYAASIDQTWTMRLLW